MATRIPDDIYALGLKGHLDQAAVESAARVWQDVYGEAWEDEARKILRERAKMMKGVKRAPLNV